MQAGFCGNALSYFLALRLIPLFPLWLVNLVPALCGVKLRTFVIGTLIGIIPGAFVYALLGIGLDSVLESGGALGLGIIFQPKIVLPICGLALLALLPVIYKIMRARLSHGFRGSTRQASSP